MSGFVGIINLDRQPVNRELLTQMMASLVFRGPDGTKTWVQDNVGLGHALLRTNKEDLETLPLSLDGETWLTGHARIDGLPELATKLSRHFPALKQSLSNGFSSNGTLILLAYQVWGEDCVQHLIGDFSFAIWDEPRQRLFCARDQMGVGQFYYTFDGRTFVCGNTLNCLRLHPAVSSKLNEVAIGDFLLFGLNQHLNTTVFADIKRLPRAHSMIASSDSMRTYNYWMPSVKPIRYKSSSEYLEEFRELLEVAVNDRLTSHQVAIAMSGGLDSSAIAAIASAALKTKDSAGELKAFCVVYEAFPDDEKLYAREVAHQLGCSIEYLEADAINHRITPRTWGFAPEPFDVEPFYVVVDEILERMASASRVALTGWDGDTFMTESPKHLFYELWRKQQFGTLVREMSSYVHHRHSPPPIGLRTWWQRRTGKVNKPIYPTWINEEFEKRLNLRERWQEKIIEPESTHSTRPHALRNLDSPHWDSLFARYDPGITGLPLEVRHPFIDVRLVDYLLGLPIIPWLLGKYILREAMRGVLPESVRVRQKTTLAGDPGMQIRDSAKFKQIDTFLPMPEVLNYIKRDAVSPLRSETDTYKLWANARPFSLNQWFINSYRNVNSTVEHLDDNYEHSQTHRPRSKAALHQTYANNLR